MNKRENFINKAKKIYGDRFDYSLVEYKQSTDKVNIICSEHKITFSQFPSEHLRGRIGCSSCSTKKIVDTKTFIKEAMVKHSNKYDYSLSKYIDSKTNVKIICKEHGIFEQQANNHANGQGCPICGSVQTAKKKTKSSEQFINEANLKHNNRYDYSVSDYINGRSKIQIICKEHGLFEQTPHKHLIGQGCKKCFTTKLLTIHNSSQNEIIDKANETHNFKYDYSLVNYINSHIKIKIICPKHGIFEQLPYDHISNHGCVRCTSSVSKPENEICDFLKSFNLKVKTSTTSIIKPQQLDIYLPDYNIAIEFNGLYWHNELKLDKNYHLNKTNICKQNGIKLIHIFEDEWLYKQDIVKSRLLNILGLTKNKIFARKCIIKEVSSKESRLFLENNHLQGFTNSSVNVGLYYNNELISLMTFNKPRLGIGFKHDGYELSRFASKLDCNVIGGADKLLNYFVKNHNPKSIISYADRRWSQGDLYEKLGFELVKVNKPNYWYIVGKIRKHRFNFRKTILAKEGFDTINKTEHQIMLEREIYRIYDCGTITYIKKY